MNIDVELLEKCSVLTDYEKDLIRRIDVHHETQVRVARHYGKSPGTISLQHKKALEKFLEWKERSESPHGANLDRYVFDRLNRGDSPWLIIAEIGRTDEVMELSEKWRQLHADDYWAARSFLDSYGLMQGFEEEEQPLAKAVESVVNWLEDVQQDLNRKESENENLLRQLEDLTNRLSNASNRLDEAKAEIKRLSKLKKYEELSEGERQALQSKVDSLKNEIKDLKWKTEKLKMLKAGLEKEVEALKQAEADVKRDIREAVLEYLASLKWNDVLKLYNTALMKKVEKKIVTY